jgi:hypothetical protein
MVMAFLKGVAESDNIPNATSIFKGVITESILWIKLQEVPSARIGLNQSSHQETANNGASNRESAEHFQAVATNLTFCLSQGLFSELGQMIAKLTAQSFADISQFGKDPLPVSRAVDLKDSNLSSCTYPSTIYDPLSEHT